MSISKEESKQLLERLIFDKERPQDWVQDVWGMSPTLGETAAKLLDVFEVLVASCPEAELNDVLQTFAVELLEEDQNISYAQNK
ncbi:MAG: hypothetical protein MGF17_10980 [Trichodesmium sp. MAG_R04]|nr:hypothetical protein [Trichodesmium sp. MAG_R04]